MAMTPIYLALSLLTKSVAFSLFLISNESPGTPLTQDEKQLITSIFNDEVNVNRVFIHRSDPLATERGSAGFVHITDIRPNRHVYMAPSMESSDYGQLAAEFENYHKFQVFVHEMTHIWQGPIKATWKELTCVPSGHNNNYTFGDPEIDVKHAPYTYTLEENKKFSEFCIEQQANIVASYALIFLRPDIFSFYPNEQLASGMSNEVFLSRLKTVVEDRFPQARISRLNTERSEKAPAP